MSLQYEFMTLLKLKSNETTRQSWHEKKNFHKN